MTRRALFGAAALAGAAALRSVVALCAGGGALEVAQPLIGYEGIHVSRVSYVMGVPYVLVPGYQVQFVGEPSCVCDGHGKSMNRNAASFLGIKTGYDPYHGTSRLRGDTLHVFLDLSGLRAPGPELNDFSVDTVIEATVQSVLLTALECRTGVSEPDTGLVDAKYIWLEVRGSGAYAGLGGVFSVEELGPRLAKRFFY